MCSSDLSIKGGCKAITRGQEVPVPVLTLEQRIEIGIRCAVTVYKDPGFQSWANAWLSGEDRTAKAVSYAAADAANAAGANGNTLDVDGIIKSVLAGSEGERK